MAGFEGGALQFDLGKAAGAGGVLSAANPEGVDLIITDFFVRITAAGPSGTVDAGIAADGSTSADNLIDGGNMNATGLLRVGGTNGIVPQEWPADKFLTISASADPSASSLAGVVYVKYVHA